MEQEVATLSELIRGTHKRLRQVVDGLSPDALAYTPAPDTSSLAILVRHTLRSEGAMLGKLADRPFARVYEEDFLNTPTTSQDLLQQLDAADRLLGDWSSLITREALHARFPRPTNVVLSGAEYMIHHYGHAKEHVAHAELTLQFIRAMAPGIA